MNNYVQISWLVYMWVAGMFHKKENNRECKTKFQGCELFYE